MGMVACFRDLIQDAIPDRFREDQKKLAELAAADN
jgi:hypothetical protein